MFTKIKIGEMAKLNDLSVQTLRYYEEVGLLTPKEVDQETGYRYYHIDQSVQLDIIQLLKALNFSLAEIKALAANEYQGLSAQLAEKEVAMQAEQKQLQYRLALIHSLQRGEQQFQQLRQEPDIRLQQFPSRRLHTFDIQRNIYQMSLSEYEYQLRLFKLHLNQQAAPFVFNRVGSLLSKDHFEAGLWDSRQLCILLPSGHKSKLHNRTLPAGTYAVTYCDAFEKEVAVLQDFRLALLDQGYQITGDYICEVIYELPKKNDGQREMLIRLQVPVASK